MLTVKQIETIIGSELLIAENHDNYSNVTAAAQKIHDLCKPSHDIHVAAAALENEVTSTLLDMLAATILATLINEEGGGRTNIRFSPGSMQEAMADWTYIVEHEGMVRNVRITPRDPAAWDNTEPPSKLHSLLMSEDAPPVTGDFDPVLPQAEPRYYIRPEWVISWKTEEGVQFYRCHDRADAERQLREWKPTSALTGMAHVENRWCVHPECPSSGCNHDPSKRDPEPTSE